MSVSQQPGSHFQISAPIMLTPSMSMANNMYGNQVHHQVTSSPVIIGVEGQGQIQTHAATTLPVPQQQPPTQQQSSSDVYMRNTIEVETTVLNLEQCCVCSTFFEANSRPIPHPDLARIICKVLDVTPPASFYRDYLSICVNCTNLLRKFDRLRVELEFTKTQIVTYVVESLTQIRVEGGSHLDCLKSQIIDKWTTSGQSTRDGKKKGKGKEGFVAGGGSGDLSWAAHNNVMKDATPVTTHIGTWTSALETPASFKSPPQVDHDYQSDNDNGGDDLLHNVSDGDMGSENVSVVEQKTCSQDMTGNNVSNVEEEILPTLKKKRKKKSKKKKREDGGVAPLICVNCGRIFSQRVSFNGHVQACTSDDLGMSKNCSICTEEQTQPCLFETWEEFKVHVNIYHPFVKLETCAVCRVNFLPKGVKQHSCSRPYRSQVDNEAIFQCDRCDRAYNTRANLVDHVRRNHKDEQHRCDVCDKVYGSPMLLSFHVKRHTNVVSKFQCKHCGVCFTTNYGLKEHTKRHTGELPYECKECGRKFASLSIFRNHKMVHENTKPHVCDICGVGFKTKSTLSRHVNRHQLNETNYTKKCPLCPKAMFRRIWILKKHMESAHPGTAEREEILEKYKNINDAPKKTKDINRTLRGKGRKISVIRMPESSESEESSDDDDNNEMIVDDASDDDVKPTIDGGEIVIEEDVSDAPAPSRQSERLRGKSKTKKIIVVLAKDD